MAAILAISCRSDVLDGMRFMIICQVRVPQQGRTTTGLLFCSIRQFPFRRDRNVPIVTQECFLQQGKSGSKSGESREKAGTEQTEKEGAGRKLWRKRGNRDKQNPIGRLLIEAAQRGIFPSGKPSAAEKRGIRGNCVDIAAISAAGGESPAFLSSEYFLSGHVTGRV